MIETHRPNDQFPFKENNVIRTTTFNLFRDNGFTKNMINNRHDFKMSKYNNAGYGYQIFYGEHHVGAIWFLNQVNVKTSYVRISRYQSTHHGFFIAVLDELNDFFNKSGYSLMLKTSITYAQDILDKNYVGTFSKASKGKRGRNDRSKKSVAVDGMSYDLSNKRETFDKWHDDGYVIDA